MTISKMAVSLVIGSFIGRHVSKNKQNLKEKEKAFPLQPHFVCRTHSVEKHERHWYTKESKKGDSNVHEVASFLLQHLVRYDVG